MMDHEPLRARPRPRIPPEEGIQRDPMMSDGRANRFGIVFAALAIVAIIGLVLYGLMREPDQASTAAGAPTAGSSATPSNPAPATTGQSPQAGAQLPDGQPRPADQGAGSSAGQGAR